MLGEEITRDFTVTLLEDGVVQVVRTLKGKYSELLARLQKQNPEAATSEELYDCGRAINLRKATLVKGNRSVTLHV